MSAALKLAWSMLNAWLMQGIYKLIIVALLAIIIYQRIKKSNTNAVG
jgi:hypothetical protein